MFLKAKHYTIILIGFAFALVFTSCGENKSDAAAEKESGKNDIAYSAFSPDAAAEPAAENTARTNVFQIKSVAKPVKGKAVDFTWEENGRTIKFSELTKNKVVFINFWGTWCPPCRREIPDIVAIDKEKGDDLILIGMALEHERNPQRAAQKVSSFAKKNGIKYRNFIASRDIAVAYGGINSVPTTFIIDKNGNVNQTIVGMRNKEAFEQAIQRARGK